MTAIALSLSAAGLTALCVALFPHHLPTPQNPQVVDVAVFDSRPVIWAARLLLVSVAFVLAVGGAFVVASTVVRMRNGDWLRRAGPFEVSESSVGDLEDDIYLWRSTAHMNSTMRSSACRSRSTTPSRRTRRRPPTMITINSDPMEQELSRAELVRRLAALREENRIMRRLARRNFELAVRFSELHLEAVRRLRGMR